MRKYSKNRFKSQKVQKFEKNRQKSKKNIPPVLMLLPIALTILTLWLNTDPITDKILIGAAVFIITYIILTIAWAIYYRYMLSGATLKQIDKMSGEDFENYLALLYRKRKENGQPKFTSVETTPKTCDYGADLLLRTTDGRKIVVQAKRYRNKVPESAVQQVISAKEYYRCDRAVVITNSVYTDAAKTLARKCDVVLIDRYKLGKGVMYNV